MKQMRAGSGGIIPAMLEHVAVALWGCCAVLERDGELGRLADDIGGLPDLLRPGR